MGLVACWNAPTVDMPAPSAGPANPTGPAIVPDDLAVFVVETKGFGIEPTPLAGAKVLVDQCGGGRLALVADAEGRVRISGADFAAGVTVTAYAEGHALATMVGLNPAALGVAPVQKRYPKAGNAPVLFLAPLVHDEPTVKLHGTILHKKDAANVVALSAATNGALRGGTFEAARDSYELVVPKGRPIALVALESKPSASATAEGYEETKVRWMRVDVSARDLDGTLDIDLDAAAPLLPASGSAWLFPPKGLPKGALPTWRVSTAQSGGALLLGSRSRVIPCSDGFGYDTSGEWVTFGADVLETQVVFPGLDGAISFGFAPGGPGSGPMQTSFLDIPGAPEGAALGELVRLDGIGALVDQVGVAVHDRKITTDAGDDVLVWSIDTMRGVPQPWTIPIPDLPADARALLPPTPYGRVRVTKGRYSAEQPDRPARVAYGKFFPITL